jgi:light-regulated signal transduction histidine kinase (bacteriophytochrome)
MLDCDWSSDVCSSDLGVPQDQLENIFAVFRRLHSSDQYEGTGIGLAICRKIVQHHRGELWAESAGAGTSLHIRLPAA